MILNIQPPRKTTLNVIFCLPGNSYSGNFLRGWSEVLFQCPQHGIKPILIQDYDPVVYYARNKCLGGSVLRGGNQKPYDGKIDYDFMMWIDSDVLFTFDQFTKLINWNKEIVSGIYMMKDNEHFATVPEWNIDYFKQTGSFKFLTPADIVGKTDLMEVAYTGFGFMLMKKGVMETMDYPWFRPIMHDFSGEQGIIDFSSEDSSMCYLLREKGFKIFVDPTIRVGHEKTLVL
jgi:hypothetical protein